MQALVPQSSVGFATALTVLTFVHFLVAGFHQISVVAEDYSVAVVGGLLRCLERRRDCCEKCVQALVELAERV